MFVFRDNPLAFNKYVYNSVAYLTWTVRKIVAHSVQEQKCYILCFYYLVFVVFKDILLCQETVRKMSLSKRIFGWLW